MIVDGRALAKEVLVRAKTRALSLGRDPHVLAIVTNETFATKSYLSIKEKRAVDAGCVLEIMRFPEDTTTAALRAAVRATHADAIIVQLPLPLSIDTKEVCDAIPVAKDADVLSSIAREKFEQGEDVALLPPVVGALREILEKNFIRVQGKKAVVIGAGFLVGAPSARWLMHQGALVEVVTLESDLSILKDADLIISGAGSPHLIKPHMLKPGVVLIDAGTSESNGEVVGDAEPLCADLCSVFTPVPGGVGPLAVACLFENVVILAKSAMNS